MSDLKGLEMVTERVERADKAKVYREGYISHLINDAMAEASQGPAQTADFKARTVARSVLETALTDASMDCLVDAETEEVVAARQEAISKAQQRVRRNYSESLEIISLALEESETGLGAHVAPMLESILDNAVITGFRQGQHYQQSLEGEQ